MAEDHAVVNEYGYVVTRRHVTVEFDVHVLEERSHDWVAGLVEDHLVECGALSVLPDAEDLRVTVSDATLPTAVNTGNIPGSATTVAATSALREERDLR